MDHTPMTKKVLMLANIPEEGRYKGGISYVAEEILNSRKLFIDEGYEIQFLNTEMIKRKSDSENKWKYENIVNAYLLYKGVRKQLEKDCYNILYIHSGIGLGLLKFCWIIRKLRNRFKGNMILHIHYSELDKILCGRKILGRYILKTISRYINKVIFLSPRTRDEFVNAGINKSKSYVLFNFQTLSIPHEYIMQKINRSDSKEKLDLLFIGSIDKRKGIIDLLESLKNTKSDKYTLHICGTISDYSIEEDFNSLVKSLDKKVVIHGYIAGEEKIEIYKKADVLILPSYGEGLPIVILEAMASACAIVSTYVGAIPEVLGHTREALLTFPSNITVLTEYLNLLINNRGLLKHLMNNSYSSSDQYEMNKFINNLINVFNK